MPAVVAILLLVVISVTEAAPAATVQARPITSWLDGEEVGKAETTIFVRAQVSPRIALHNWTDTALVAFEEGVLQSGGARTVRVARLPSRMPFDREPTLVHTFRPIDADGVLAQPTIAYSADTQTAAIVMQHCSAARGPGPLPRVRKWR